MVKRLVLAIAVAMFVAGPLAYAGVGPGNLCKEAKAKATGMKASDLLKAFGKNIKKPDPDKLDSAISKAQSKFTKAFSKADLTGDCLTLGDSDAIGAKVDAFVVEVDDALTCHDAFRDLGDGTIEDRCTGLQWEKKTGDDGGADPDDLHDVDNKYSWAGQCQNFISVLYCQPNAAAAATCLAEATGPKGFGCEECPSGEGPCILGEEITTIWDWINQVNAEGFAGHSDWRLPNDAGLNVNYYARPQELPTLYLKPFPWPCSQPCIDPIFGPTQAAHYWSSTTEKFSAEYAYGMMAWIGCFDGGEVQHLWDQKESRNYVRAVRDISTGSASGAYLVTPLVGD